MATAWLSTRKAFDLSSTHVVVANQQDDKGELGMQPALLQEAGRENDQPDTEHEGGDHRGHHDAPVQLALHGAETLATYGVFAHGVIDE